MHAAVQDSTCRIEQGQDLLAIPRLKNLGSVSHRLLLPDLWGVLTRKLYLSRKAAMSPDRPSKLIIRPARKYAFNLDASGVAATRRRGRAHASPFSACGRTGLERWGEVQERAK